MRRGLVVGRAATVWDELEAARALADFDVMIAVGRVGVDLPGAVDHWVSFHANLFDKWAGEREAHGHPPAGVYWGVLYRGKPLGDGKAPTGTLRLVKCEGGSSGLAGALVAARYLELDRSVLAGVPMTCEGGRYDDAGPWKEAIRYLGEWRKHLDVLEGRVRSMSGNTADLLGRPTQAWLEGRSDARSV